MRELTQHNARSDTTKTIQNRNTESEMNGSSIYLGKRGTFETKIRNYIDIRSTTKLQVLKTVVKKQLPCKGKNLRKPLFAFFEYKKIVCFYDIIFCHEKRRNLKKRTPIKFSRFNCLLQ